MYALLLGLLLHVEKGGKDFNNVWDGLWYTLATLTTVGYGDIAPRTGPGRIIGAVFMLLSYGLLAMILSAAISTFRGRMLPRVRLWAVRRKPWYVFTSTCPRSIRLAESFHDCTVVFLTQEELPQGMLPGIQVKVSPGQLKKAAKNELTFFVFGEDTLENRRQCDALKQYGKVYCCTEFSGKYDPRVDYFNPWESCARQYWQKQPLLPGEKQIVVFGGSRWMPPILHQALLVNVLSDAPDLCYHVCGDSRRFREDHFRLQDFLGVNCKIPGRDSIFFHGEGIDPEVLLHADRIILCCDSDRENMDLLTRIRASFPTSAKIDIHLEQRMPGLDANVFGDAESLLTPENVLHHSLDRVAMELNDRYNRQNPEYAVEWNQLSAYSRGSNLAAADHQLVKVRILLDDFSITEETDAVLQKAKEAYRSQVSRKQETFRRIEHARWGRYLYANNWSFGLKRNNAERIHTMLTDYESLSPADKAKDDNPWKAIGADE